MASLLEESNYDDVFLRNIIVGMCSFMYDVITIPQVANKIKVIKKVPFYYSDAGDEQFMTDFFLNTDKYCNELGGKKAEGNINTVPSGRLTIVNANISSDNVTGGYTMAEFMSKVDTDFGIEARQVSARTRFIPISLNWEAKIICGSALERWKCFQAIITKLWKVKRFYIHYAGFSKLPVDISFPESYDQRKIIPFQYAADNKRPMLTFSIDMLTYLPQIDETTMRNNEETIEKPNVKINTKKT